MTTVTAKFNGKQNDLEMFLNCGIKDYSSKFLGINNLYIEWNLEELNKEKAIETCMSLVSTHQMGVWNIEIIKFETK